MPPPAGPPAGLDAATATRRLAVFYGPLAPPPDDPFVFYLWEVLGTGTTPGRRDAALAALRRVPALTPESLRRVPRGRLEPIVRACGPFTDQRLAAIEAGIDVFRRQPHFAERLRGRLRTAWLAGRDLPHLGSAGAARLLLFAGPHALVPVDAAMARLATRLGLARPRTGVKRLVRDTRRALDAWLPRALDERRHAVLHLQHHAQVGCTDAAPHCGVCPLRDACPEATVTPAT
jgi:endonuclease III